MDASPKTNPKPQHELTEYALELVHCRALLLVGKVGYQRDDVNDIKQDLIMDLLEALPTFDPAKAAYNTFVSRVVTRKISNLIRHRKAQARDPRREACSLNDDVDIGEEEMEPLFTTINEDDHDLRRGKYRRTREEREDLRLDIDSAISELPLDLQHVAELLMSMTPAEVARELNMTTTAFNDKYMTRLRQAFAAKGMADHLV